MGISILPVVENGRVERFVLLACNSPRHQENVRFAVPETFFRNDNESIRCPNCGCQIDVGFQMTSLDQRQWASDEMANR